MMFHGDYRVFQGRLGPGITALGNEIHLDMPALGVSHLSGCVIMLDRLPEDVVLHLVYFLEAKEALSLVQVSRYS